MYYDDLNTHKISFQIHFKSYDIHCISNFLNYILHQMSDSSYEPKMDVDILRNH